jgi:PTH1 family peptidyl-tRNA hydrolase
VILVVGLGNPGKQYSMNRHNVGFMALDYLSSFYQISFSNKSKFNCEISLRLVGQHKLLLAKPISFMNLSGKPIQSLCSYYNIAPENIYVIHDDVKESFIFINISIKLLAM